MVYRVTVHGMWRAVRRREKAGLPVRAIFTEFHDPAQTDPAEDAMDPVKRVQMFHKMGARQLGSPAFTYFQPPLNREEGEALAEAEHRPFLLAVIVTRRTARDEQNRPFVPRIVVKEFLTSYYEDCAGEGYQEVQASRQRAEG